MNHTSLLVPAAASLAALGLGAVIGFSGGSLRRGNAPRIPPVQLAAAGAPPEEGPTLDLAGLACLDGSPERFYLPDSGLTALSDAIAVVENVRLPLHRQVLSTQSGVLRELFLSACDDGGAGCEVRTQELFA